jgi:NADPH:quinone reductase-like Zn-dependent oxidoreductase
MFALKLARAAGLKVILTSSSDDKLRDIQAKFPSPPILTVNYAKTSNWHEQVLELTDGVGVDLVIEIGGSSSLVKSMKCTRRGGIISQVGYLSKPNVNELEELLPVIIDRRVNLRGINAGSKQDQDDLFDAITATQMQFGDIIDSVMDFEKAEEAIEYIWQGKQVGKLVLTL